MSVIILCVGLFVLFAPIPTVHAHAALVEMEPAEGAVAKEAPSMLKLRFNEPIEHALATVTVYDSNGTPVYTGHPIGDRQRAPLLAFSLPQLKRGTYMVKWNIVSSDGHPVSGSSIFSVGTATKNHVQSADEDTIAAVGLIVARSITEVFILLGAGLFWFSWLAERRKFPSLDSLWRKGRWIAAILLVLGTLAELITYGMSLPAGMIQVIMNGRWELLQQFPFILMVCAQILFLILLFIRGMERGWYLTIWFILAATPAFGGHVWGMENPIIALIPRIIHQLSIAFWLGALCYVILLLIGQRQQTLSISWKEFRPFFVNKMLVASGLAIVSGFIMAYLQTGITAIFTNWMTWSMVAMMKVILTAAMIGLAIMQTLKWKKTGMFTTNRIIRTEWLIGLVIIVLGVWMSQIAYPIAVTSYDETLVAEQVEANVSIERLQMGDQKMVVHIATLDGERPVQVTVEVSMPDHDISSGKLPLEQDDSGRYTVELPFTMGGLWLIKMTATYPDGQTREWQDDMMIVGSED